MLVLQLQLLLIFFFFFLSIIQMNAIYSLGSISLEDISYLVLAFMGPA